MLPNVIRHQSNGLAKEPLEQLNFTSILSLGPLRRIILILPNTPRSWYSVENIYKSPRAATWLLPVHVLHVHTWTHMNMNTQALASPHVQCQARWITFGLPLWRDLTKVSPSLTRTTWDWRVPAVNQTLDSTAGRENKELIKQLVNSYSEHLHDPYYWRNKTKRGSICFFHLLNICTQKFEVLFFKTINLL